MRSLLLAVTLFAPVASAQEASEAPSADAPDYVFRRAVEVLKQGDDRDARRIEALLDTEPARAIQRCRDEALARGAEPRRFVQVQIKLKPDGTVQKSKIAASSGDATLDTCARDHLVELIHLDPPPRIGYSMAVGLTWAVLPEDAADATP